MDISPAQHEPNDEHYTTEDLLRIARDVAGTDLAKAVSDFVIASNIAKPGAVHTLNGLVVANGELVRRNGIGPFSSDVLYTAVQHAAALGWPAISAKGALDTWRWVNHIEGLPDGVPTGRVGRAFAAITYLLTDDDALYLVWGLLGLEALYGLGNAGLKEQLTGKAAAFLGQPFAHKKVFGKAYDFRSRFVHGDVYLPLAYSPYSATDQFSKYFDDYSKSSLTCIAVLLATLQKMVTLNVYELKFSYEWTDWAAAELDKRRHSP